MQLKGLDSFCAIFRAFIGDRYQVRLGLRRIRIFLIAYIGIKI